MFKKIFTGLGILFLISCGGSSSTPSTSTGLQFNSAADFTASASASISALMKATTTGTCNDLTSPITQDDPSLADGLDCDDDGGIVAHITPSAYSVAFKKVILLAADANSTDIDLIADTGTLAQSEIVDFTTDSTSETVITISPDDLQAGTYSGIQAEIYYFQMTFPVGETTQIVRTYLSDDDFTSEGSLGHHQGDITFINDDGTEAGWVDSAWLSENISSSRTADQNGAGGTDAETGHDRGFFGDSTLWDSSDFMQGADQDIYVTTLDFDTSLDIPDPSTITGLTTVTATFSTADTFFYEDFAPQGTGFFPDTGGEATSENAAWAPLIPTAALSVTSE